MQKTLDTLKVGDYGVISSLGTESSVLRRKFIDMGLTTGATVVMKKIAPLGDPLEISVRGYELGLRKHEASDIIVDVQGENNV